MQSLLVSVLSKHQRKLVRVTGFHAVMLNRKTLRLHYVRAAWKNRTFRYRYTRPVDYHCPKAAIVDLRGFEPR